MAEQDWKREFDEMGVAGVRSGLTARRWRAEKQSAAREWLERADAQNWAATRAGSDGEARDARSTMDVFRRYKWVYYIVGGGFGLLALSQMLHIRL